MLKAAPKTAALRTCSGDMLSTLMVTVRYADDPRSISSREKYYIIFLYNKIQMKYFLIRFIEINYK